MQNQISTFNFKSSSVRIEVINNEPLFCLADVCSALSISNANSSRFRLNEDGIHKMYSVDKLDRKNELTFINEPNLYRIIFRSNKTEAVEFQNWVFEEVLPQIRKTGKYSLEQLQQPRIENKTTSDDRAGLRNAVNMLVSKKGLLYNEAYNLVHHYMNVESIEDIEKSDLPKAVAYVHKLVLEGELIDPPKPKSHIINNEVSVAADVLKSVLIFSNKARELARRVMAQQEALAQIIDKDGYIRPALYGYAHDVFQEYNYFLDKIEDILDKNAREQREKSMKLAIEANRQNSILI